LRCYWTVDIHHHRHHPTTNATTTTTTAAAAASPLALPSGRNVNYDKKLFFRGKNFELFLLSVQVS
jgi:hypothetical protein